MADDMGLRTWNVEDNLEHHTMKLSYKLLAMWAVEIQAEIPVQHSYTLGTFPHIFEKIGCVWIYFSDSKREGYRTGEKERKENVQEK